MALGAGLPMFGHTASDPSAAVCAIRYQDQWLLVQDRVSTRYSLSGGYLDRGESSQQTALRELYEETGLYGEVVAPLGRWQRAEIFACRTRAPIVAQHDTGFVSILQAPDLGGEILSARLVSAAQLPRDQRRFPDQIDWLQTRLSLVPESEVRWQADFIGQGNVLHQTEIPLIQAIQQQLGRDVWWLTGSNLFGSGTFQLALIPLLLPLLGWPRLRQLLFAMLWLGVIIQGSKAEIGWPRPFHLLPELATQSAQGFGMPSGHTASALLFWGMLLTWYWPTQRWLATTLALLLASMTGLARVWLGVHFISDVVAGLLIGALLLALQRRWAATPSPLGWQGLLVVSILLASWNQSAVLAGFGCLALGVILGERWPLRKQGYPAINVAATALTGGALLGGLLWLLPLLTTSSLLLLLGQWALYCGFGLWLSAGLWWILSQVNTDISPRGPAPDKGTR
ncbi:phosphatase PAP2 family protein [Aeromonas cavernicola]|nr:bifunctional NUDIX hydrolase/phosphatase PAP2 family protein [Aeromonas cavernicola]